MFIYQFKLGHIRFVNTFFLHVDEKTLAKLFTCLSKSIDFNLRQEANSFLEACG